MAKHLLSLFIPDITNEGILLIEDTSVYTDMLPVSCPNLQILPPGYIQPLSIDVTAGFRIAFNACTLGMLPMTGCSDSCPNLPDGIYDIRYSVSPNDTVFVSYKYFRTTAAINRYQKALCDLNLKCCLPDQETEYLLSQLAIIHSYLVSAKVTCEDQHSFDTAMSQYRYAITLLDKMSTCRPICGI